MKVVWSIRLCLKGAAQIAASRWCLQGFWPKCMQRPHWVCRSWQWAAVVVQLEMRRVVKPDVGLTFNLFVLGVPKSYCSISEGIVNWLNSIVSLADPADLPRLTRQIPYALYVLPDLWRGECWYYTMYAPASRYGFMQGSGLCSHSLKHMKQAILYTAIAVILCVPFTTTKLSDHFYASCFTMHFQWY